MLAQLRYEYLEEGAQKKQAATAQKNTSNARVCIKNSAVL
jgi:hypothetical protein